MSWYYQVEMEPGQFTPGKPRPTLALSRAMLASVPLAGHTCLDIGTQDGVMSALITRAGGVVTATDIASRLETVDPVRERYVADFRYVAGVTLAELPEKLDREVFDIVNFSGVLYHSINPLGCLAQARSRCRVGGLMLVETAAIQESEAVVAFNANESLGVADGTYFMPSTAALEYWIRLVGLRPLAGAYQGKRKRGSKIRVAVLCASEARACPREEPDICMASERVRRNFGIEGGLDWDALDVGGETLEPGEYEPGVFSLKDTSLFDAIKKNRWLHTTENRERLELDARI